MGQRLPHRGRLDVGELGLLAGVVDPQLDESTFAEPTLPKSDLRSNVGAVLAQDPYDVSSSPLPDRLW
jgi:hypothetical protein